MASETLERINAFLASHGASTETISKTRLTQFEKVDAAIQERLGALEEARKTLKGKAISVASIAEATGIARKTFYNNELLRLYVESYSPDDDIKASRAELERLKAKYAEAQRQIKQFLLRDVATENLRQENMKLQAEIHNLEVRNQSLEEQHEKMYDEMNKMKKMIPTDNILQFKK